MRYPQRRAALFWFSGAIIILLLSDIAMAGRADYLGPLPMRNHHPLYVGLLYPPPESGTTVKSATWRAAMNYTNIFLFDSEGRWSAFIDKELAELDLSVRFALANGRIEVGAEIPVYHSSTGFMDGSIRWFHSRLGVSGYGGQTEIPDYNYSDVVKKEGRPIMTGSKGILSAGDAAIWIKAGTTVGKRMDLAVQGLLQAPTGNADAGEGSGEWEFGARLLGTVSVDKYALHFGAGAMEPGKIKRSGQVIDLNRMLAGFISYEYYAKERLRLIVQSMFNTSPFENSDLERFRKEWVEATVGFKYRLASGSILAVGFSENLNRSAPDFTIHISLEK